MKSNNKIFGNFGEETIANHLSNKGYTILEKQFTINHKIGEIDIIAKKDNIIIFCEVKTRKKYYNISVNELISKKKQNKIIKMAFHYLQKKNILLSEYIIRFDIAFLLNNELNYYENAFTL